MFKEKAGFGRRIKEYFTGKEEMNIHAAQQAYMMVYDVKDAKDLPQPLSKDQPSVPINSDRIAFWQQQHLKQHTGLLRVSAEKIIGSICAYQYIRNDRFLGSGYLDDPINNVCYELNLWAAKLATMDITLAVLPEIEKRIKYLMAIIENEQAFKQGKGHTQTLKGSLLQVVIQLKTVKAKVENHLKNESAREKMKQLIVLNEQIFNNAFLSLVGFFPSSAMNPNTAMDHFNPGKQVQQIQEVNKLKELNLGKLLSFLAIHIQSITDPNVSITNLANPFIKESGQTGLPGDLQKLQHKNSSDIDFLLLKNSGLADCFSKEKLDRSGLIKSIYQICAQVVFLARQGKTLELAYKLAGEGGDLLMYGDSNASTNNFLDLYEGLLKQFKTIWQKIFSVLDVENNSIILNNKCSTEMKVWSKNFNSFKSSAYNFLEGNWLNALESISDIRKHANSITIEERKAKIKEDVQCFNNAIKNAQEEYSQINGKPVKVKFKLIKSNIDKNEGEKNKEEQNFGLSSSMYVSFIDQLDKLPTIQPNEKNSIQENHEIQINSNEISNNNSDDTEDTLQLFGLNGNKNKSEQKITDLTLGYIINNLSNKPSIRRLFIDNNNITDEGLGEIVELLNTPCVVQNNNNLKEKQKIVKPQIHTLDLSKNPLGKDSAKLINDLFALENLQILNLNNTNLGNQAGQELSNLSTNNQLIWLDVAYCGLEESAKSIANYLGDNSSMQELRIAGNAMGDEAAGSFATAFSCNKAPLKFLDMAKNNLTDMSGIKIANMVAKKPSLETLRLDENNISDDTAFALARAICNHPSLKSLYLQNTKISYKGASVLLMAMHGNKTIQEIQFGLDARHPVTKLHNFINANHNKIEMKEMKLPGSSDDFLKCFGSLISKLNGLEILDLSNNPKITDASVNDILDIIKNSQSIKTINLSGTAISKEKMQQIEMAAQNAKIEMAKAETIEINSQQKAQGGFLSNMSSYLWWNNKKDDKDNDKNSPNKTTNDSTSSQSPSFGNQSGETN